MTSPQDTGSSPTGLPRTEAILSDVRRGRRRKLLQFSIGLLLVLAAAWAAGRDPAGARRAIDSLRSAPATLLVAAAALPALSWVFTTLCFWSLTRRHGTVGVGEMSALMGSSWLLNFLPLKPGLVGRIAYHRSVNAIPIQGSLEVIGMAIACGAVSIFTALLMTIAVRDTSLRWSWSLLIFFAPVAVFFAMSWFVARAAPDHLKFRAQRLTALSWRYCDLLVWSARYMVAFELVGRPISPAQAVAVAAVSQTATLLPLIGNGLGLREWAVGLVGAALPAWFVGAGGNPAISQGLSADLINRVFEIAVAVPIGMASAAWIAARLRRLGKDPETGLPAPSDSAPTVPEGEFLPPGDPESQSSDAPSVR